MLDIVPVVEVPAPIAAVPETVPVVEVPAPIAAVLRSEKITMERHRKAYTQEDAPGGSHGKKYIAAKSMPNHSTSQARNQRKKETDRKRKLAST